jgi:hypothetical protein
MTADTGGVRSFENSAGMATVAADVLMGAIEIEARTVVVEGLLGSCRCGEKQDRKQDAY